ncbi:TIGR02530 family flagellar biosynthesis protein [Guptibacillus algicola]|uniref:TIGR02530 family flagellar biosynthesis protein n=1 Tax=Guptibacillus algicola TaxID=225844 RepID=UPI001CD719BD|nr:TIGR02530 family flagellar biosynthesis protein [Alkalihalobacillus algicola]MCA0988914.1 flagellar biosynthesis protein [Alkalihalobacillus algicola]
MTNLHIHERYHPNQPLVAAKKKPTHAFAEQLKQTLQKPVSFSQHAEQRLAQQGILLTDVQLKKLNDGVETAREKGSQDSLLLMKDLAFVVSIKNNKVITAMKQERMENQIVTKIDSALIL